MRGNEREQRQRRPLEWRTDQRFTEGRVVAQVQTAEGHHGQLYSVRFGRENQRSKDQLTPFLEARDLDALRVVLDQVDDYLREQKTRQVTERFSGNSMAGTRFA